MEICDINGIDTGFKYGAGLLFGTTPYCGSFCGAKNALPMSYRLRLSHQSSGVTVCLTDVDNYDTFSQRKDSDDLN